MAPHNFHWNVEGPMFQTLHQMFMVQYTEAWNAIDLVAERIRSLGHYAPGTYREYLELARVKETPGVPKAEHRPTLDLLTQRMQVHEKNAWMLRSLLKK